MSNVCEGECLILLQNQCFHDKLQFSQEKLAKFEKVHFYKFCPYIQTEFSNFLAFS